MTLETVAGRPRVSWDGERGLADVLRVQISWYRFDEPHVWMFFVPASATGSVEFPPVPECIFGFRPPGDPSASVIAYGADFVNESNAPAWIDVDGRGSPPPPATGPCRIVHGLAGLRRGED